MSVSYDLFTKAFLSKIEDRDLLQLSRYDAQEEVDGYMKRACARFNKVCHYDLTNRDDNVREFKDDIPDDELDDIIDIVSEGMVVQWLKPQFYKAEHYRNVLNTRDFTSYSEAELLYRTTNAYKTARQRFVFMIRQYSYDYGDLTNLWL